MQPAPGLIDDLVAANRILYDHGVLDGFGHVSARHDTDPNRFLLARSMAPALVAAADILEFDLDGNSIDPKSPRPYLERFIHSEVYRARPDVKAVVHSHSPAVIPFGATGTSLRPIYHMSSFLAEGVPIFEIRDVAGDATNMLITNGKLGAALARSLGQGSVALMRGHGNVVVADSIRLAVYRAIYTEINAKLEAEARRLGPVNYLTAAEAAGASAVNKANLGRAWELWKLKAMGRK